MKRLIVICALAGVGSPRMLPAQGDRGTGIRTSMIETYVEPHQVLIYPFGAYTWDHNWEYSPSMFGSAHVEDFRGTYKTTEAALFLAYGVTDWLAVELEGSLINATFEKSAADTFGTPATIHETGLSDVAGQLRLRLVRERGSRPEFFASVEVLPPQHGQQVLIGDAEWDVKGEIGAVRQYHWGTMTFRTTIEYNRGDTHWDLGETSLEYLRRLSPKWRVLLGIEGGEGGAPDDYGLAAAAHWQVARGLDLKFFNFLGLMSKATDWEAQFGLMWTLPQ
ncbi:MAG TPA: hypothetical protein VGN76_05435 [Gemmatimonadales bacterium]|nr:hypothetical protein [Gemmatimonadales bacterium]